MDLRWFFDGCSMVLRRISGVFASFPPISAVRPPPPHSHSHTPFRIPHTAFRTLWTPPLPKRYTPVAAQIPPPAAPEPAIQSASQPGAQTRSEEHTSEL